MSAGVGAPGFFRIGAASGAAAVFLGAFGAHALKQTFAADASGRARELWQTASSYHLTHALVLCVAAATSPTAAPASLPSACALLAAGQVIFSGSLYLLALQPERRWLGAITPIGGLLLVGGWLALAMQAAPTISPRRAI